MMTPLLFLLLAWLDGEPQVVVGDSGEPQVTIEDARFKIRWYPT